MNKKDFCLFVVLFFINCFTAFAKDTLAVLPFSGGQGEDGETIAELFSFDPTMNGTFSFIPRTSIINAMRGEQAFQLSGGGGMTDPDKAVWIGKELGAKYVIAGNITRLGNQNLLVIGILNTETLEQIAGDIQTFSQIEEMPRKLPAMARSIVTATRRDSSKLPKLATTRVVISGNDEEGDILAQILTVYLVQNGSYAVYPRTKSLAQVQEEWKNQLSGYTADENMSRIGAGENPRLALSCVARRLGSQTMFNASIIDLESGVQSTGSSVNYTSLNDGVAIMKTLATDLTSKKYVIGDTGPAGGIVFYDKGSYSDGWRYLEAAPVRYEFTVNTRDFYQDINWDDFLDGKYLDTLLGGNVEIKEYSIAPTSPQRGVEGYLSSVRKIGSASGIKGMTELYGDTTTTNPLAENEFNLLISNIYNNFKKTMTDLQGKGFTVHATYQKSILRFSGDGKTNTYNIAKLYGGKQNNVAARCLSLDINGYKDWYIPNGIETRDMYTIFKEGKFSAATYLSSSINSIYAAGSLLDNNANADERLFEWLGYDFDGGNAVLFSYSIDNGKPVGLGINETWRVRPVRSF